MSAFKKLCTPGQNMFCIWAASYGPPIADAPAQVFLGEWTGSQKGADLIAMEIDSDRQDVLGFDGVSSTQCLGIDPVRPLLWMNTGKQLLEIDRRTLKVRVACETPAFGRPTQDVDRQGRLWFAETRSLTCFDPATNELTRYPDVTPDEYFYPSGTHMTHGVGPDGRIWTHQYPVQCLAVFDPRTRVTRVVWGTPGESVDPRRTASVGGTPVAIGNLIWAGKIFVDALTAELVKPPFPVSGNDAYTLQMRGGWNRSPTGLLDRSGRALVRQQRHIGWLEVATGKFELIGDLPEAMPVRDDWSLHGENTLIAHESQSDNVIRVELQTQKTTRIQIRGPFQHAQAIFEWNVGPDSKFYGSCYSHEMWEVDQAGKFKNHGDVVRVHGGELHQFANWKNKMFIASYTHSALTRVDVTRPTDRWGTESASNPRHILNLGIKNDGQHRPSAIAVTPKGQVYYISRADYCTRREGALVAVDAETEQVLHIEDPLLPGEQPWGLAVSPTRPEIYIGTNLGTFVVWDTEKMKIKRTIRVTPREGDGQMTSAMSETGTLKFMAAVGDLVVGNRFGGVFDFFVYHADTGVMDGPAPHPRGKVFGVFQLHHKPAVLLFILGALYEFDAAGKTTLAHPEPLPGFATKEGPDGRLYISDGLSIFGEIK